jgi:hypothetical protein
VVRDFGFMNTFEEWELTEKNGLNIHKLRGIDMIKLTGGATIFHLAHTAFDLGYAYS